MLKRWIAAAERRRWVFPGCAGLAAILLLIRNLSGLENSPPGLYVDEASIGYNAWAVAHYGVDEHGIPNPLYFQAFGEYKNPIYIYVLSWLLRVFPLTPAVERLPAVIFGLITCAAIAGIAWHLSKSRWIALFALVIAGLTPWLTLQSRVGFEIPSMTALLSLALWFLCLAEERRIWFFAAGLAFGVAIFGYSTARLEVALIVFAAIILYGLHWRRYEWQWLFTFVAPVASGYLILAQWSIANPGALVNRFNLISITADNPPFGVVINRFVSGYFDELGFPFLFTHGDANLRHNTGFGGMLLVTTFPLLVLGLYAALRRFREPFPVLCVIGILSGPVGAAVTTDGLPHALRSGSMLPFLLIVMVLGVREAAILLTGKRLFIAGLFCLVVLEGAGYNWDLFTDYPTRAGKPFATYQGQMFTWFDAGQMEAIAQGHALVGSHTLYVSQQLGDGDPYILIDFGLRPVPTSAGPGYMLQSVGARIFDPYAASDFSPGDVVVTQGDQPAPANSTLALLEYPPGPGQDVYGRGQQPLVAVYVIH